MFDVLDLAIRVLVLLAVAGLGVALLRGRSASLRAAIWTAALAAALVLPVIAAAVPAWRLPIWSPAHVASAELVERVTSAGSPDTRATALAVEDGVSASISMAQSVNRATDVSGGTALPAVKLGELMPVVIAFVALVLVTRIVRSHKQMSRMAASASPAGPEWASLVAKTGLELGIGRDVPVRVTDATSVPAIAGLVRPVLLLPVDTADWPIDVRRLVVVHELAHVARRDAVSQLLGQLACAVYWFVPLTWYGAWRASTLRERASDDVVLQTGVRPSAYAGSLVTLAQSTAGVLHSAAALEMARPSRIYERVTAILNPSARRDGLTWLSASAVIGMMFCATGVVGAVQLVERQAATVVVVPDAVADQADSGSEVTARGAATAPTTIGAGHNFRGGRQDITPGPGSDSAPMPFTAQAADRLCAGRGLDRSSSSIHEDDNKRSWTVKLSGDGCSVDLRAEGRFEFNADFTDITRIPAGGFFRVDVTDRGVRRQLEIEPRDGNLVRTWRVDGRERPYDAEARAWFAAFLIELDRRTGIGVDVRLPILIRQGGVDAVLKDTALMSSDYVRYQYYTKLTKATKVTPAEAARVLRQASTMNSSDYYSAELVAAFAPTGLQDATVRAALIELVERIKSDYYQSTSISAVLGPGAPGATELDVMLRLVPRMSSDHYKGEVLMQVLKADGLNATQRATIAKAAASIDSDYNAAEVLGALARAGVSEEAVRRAYLDATATIESDHYHSEVLASLLRSRGLAERDLLDVVASSKAIGSDHYQAQVLESIARHSAATDRVRAAVLEASASLSKSYADQVRRAAGK